jgi:hypothetical protein
VGADWPEEGDVPPDGHADRRDDQSGGSQAARAGSAQAETRNRQEYYADLRVAVSTEESVTARRAAAGEQAAAEKWDKSAEESCGMWAEYQRKWPPTERAPVDRSDDLPGSWRGDLENEFIEITEDEANQIVERIRAEVTGTNNG